MKKDKVLNRIKFLFPKDFDKIEEKFNFDKINFFYDFFHSEKCIIFFSKRDSENILDRHIIEPIYCVYLIDSVHTITKKTTICDCGSGMGIPGIFFFCLKQEVQLSLLDSKRKKLFVLEKEIQNHDSFPKVHFLYQRAEECKKEFDLVLSRAFLPYPFCIEVVTNIVKKNGFYVPFLGKKKLVKSEKEFLQNNGFQLNQNLYIPKLSFLGERHILLLEKVRKPKIGYPREWKFINREIQKYHEKSNCN